MCLYFLHISADSTEKLLYSPDNDQLHSLEDFSKRNLTKEEETSVSNAMDRMESDSTKGFFKLFSFSVHPAFCSIITFCTESLESKQLIECVKWF